LSAACTSCHGRRAEAATGEGESQILWKSRTHGAHGNRIFVTMKAGGAGTPLELETTESEGGVEILVRLATDREGVSSSLAEDVIALIQSEREVYHLIQVEEGDGYLGEGVVVPAPRIALTGGADFAEQLPRYEAIVRALDAVRRARAVATAGGHALDAELVGAIEEVRRRAMEVVHAAPPAPDREAEEDLLRAAGRVLDMIDADTHSGAGGASDGS
jgi:hypothetical protein